MFNALLAEHQKKQALQREENERARKDALGAVTKLTDVLVRAVNDGVSEVFNNQRVLEAEARELQLQAVQFSKQTGRWVSMVKDFDDAMKEVGDFENWLAVMEHDIQSIATALDNAAARQALDNASARAAAGGAAGGAGAAPAGGGRTA